MKDNIDKELLQRFENKIMRDQTAGSVSHSLSTCRERLLVLVNLSPERLNADPFFSVLIKRILEGSSSFPTFKPMDFILLIGLSFLSKIPKREDSAFQERLREFIQTLIVMEMAVAAIPDSDSAADMRARFASFAETGKHNMSFHCYYSLLEPLRVLSLIFNNPQCFAGLNANGNSIFVKIMAGLITYAVITMPEKRQHLQKSSLVLLNVFIQEMTNRPISQEYKTFLNAFSQLNVPAHEQKKLQNVCEKLDTGRAVAFWVENASIQRITALARSTQDAPLQVPKLNIEADYFTQRMLISGLGQLDNALRQALEAPASAENDPVTQQSNTTAEITQKILVLINALNNAIPVDRKDEPDLINLIVHLINKMSQYSDGSDLKRAWHELIVTLVILLINEKKKGEQEKIVENLLVIRKYLYATLSYSDRETWLSEGWGNSGRNQQLDAIQHIERVMVRHSKAMVVTDLTLAESNQVLIYFSRFVSAIFSIETNEVTSDKEMLLNFLKRALKGLFVDPESDPEMTDVSLVYLFHYGAGFLLKDKEISAELNKAIFDKRFNLLARFARVLPTINFYITDKEINSLTSVGDDVARAAVLLLLFSRFSNMQTENNAQETRKFLLKTLLELLSQIDFIVMTAYYNTHPAFSLHFDLHALIHSMSLSEKELFKPLLDTVATKWPQEEQEKWTRIEQVITRIDSIELSRLLDTELMRESFPECDFLGSVDARLQFLQLMINHLEEFKKNPESPAVEQQWLRILKLQLLFDLFQGFKITNRDQQLQFENFVTDKGYLWRFIQFFHFVPEDVRVTIAQHVVEWLQRRHCYIYSTFALSCTYFSKVVFQEGIESLRKSDLANLQLFMSVVERLENSTEKTLMHETLAMLACYLNSDPVAAITKKLTERSTASGSKENNKLRMTGILSVTRSLLIASETLGIMVEDVQTIKKALLNDVINLHEQQLQRAPHLLVLLMSIIDFRDITLDAEQNKKIMGILLKAISEQDPKQEDGKTVDTFYLVNRNALFLSWKDRESRELVLIKQGADFIRQSVTRFLGYIKAEEGAEWRADQAQFPNAITYQKEWAWRVICHLLYGLKPPEAEGAGKKSIQTAEEKLAADKQTQDDEALAKKLLAVPLIHEFIYDAKGVQEIQHFVNLVLAKGDVSVMRRFTTHFSAFTWQIDEKALLAIKGLENIEPKQKLDCFTLVLSGFAEGPVSQQQQLLLSEHFSFYLENIAPFQFILERRKRENKEDPRSEQDRVIKQISAVAERLLAWDLPPADQEKLIEKMREIIPKYYFSQLSKDCPKLYSYLSAQLLAPQEQPPKPVRKAKSAKPVSVEYVVAPSVVTSSVRIAAALADAAQSVPNKPEDGQNDSGHISDGNSDAHAAGSPPAEAGEDPGQNQAIASQSTTEIRQQEKEAEAPDEDAVALSIVPTSTDITATPIRQDIIKATNSGNTSDGIPDARGSGSALADSGQELDQNLALALPTQNSARMVINHWFFKDFQYCDAIRLALMQVECFYCIDDDGVDWLQLTYHERSIWLRLNPTRLITYQLQNLFSRQDLQINQMHLRGFGQPADVTGHSLYVSGIDGKFNYFDPQSQQWQSGRGTLISFDMKASNYFKKVIANNFPETFATHSVVENGTGNVKLILASS